MNKPKKMKRLNAMTKVLKSIMAIIIVFVLLVSMTSCDTFREDKIPATATITTSKEAYVVNSVNGSYSTRSGAVRAVNQNQVVFTLEKGEEACIHFYCPACGYEKTEKFTAPYANLFACQCPENIDQDGNAREYLSVAVGLKEDK